MVERGDQPCFTQSVQLELTESCHDFQVETHSRIIIPQKYAWPGPLVEDSFLKEVSTPSQTQTAASIYLSFLHR